MGYINTTVMVLFLAVSTYFVSPQIVQADTAATGKRSWLRTHATKSCRKFKRIASRIQMSEEQKIAVAEIFDDMLDEIEENSETLRDARSNLFEAIHAVSETGEVDGDGIRSAHEILSILLEERALLSGETMVALQQVLEAQQYEDFVRSKLHLHACTSTGEIAARRYLKHWVDNQLAGE